LWDAKQGLARSCERVGAMIVDWDETRGQKAVTGQGEWILGLFAILVPKM